MGALLSQCGWAFGMSLFNKQVVPSMKVNENEIKCRELLNRLTQPTSDVAVIKVSFEGKLVRVIANLPGQAMSLRAISHFAEDGRLTPRGIRGCLEIFAPLLPEATTQPGRHPTLDLLLSVRGDQMLTVERVSASEDLLSAIVSGKATESQKQEGIDLLDRGLIRCAERLWHFNAGSDGVALTGGASWVTQQYGVACMNAGFSAFPMTRMDDYYFDKVPLKTEGWTLEDFERAGVRFIPGCFVRRGAYVGSGTTVMPGGIVNIGAYVAGSGVMIDGGARVATGAQVGTGVKLGAGSGIEGILEPTGRLPSIIEDNVRVGANCEICGIVEEGAVIASGVIMASGKKIFDLRTGAEVEPRYMAIGDTFFSIPVIPQGRVAVGGVYQKTAQFGIDCILLLEKDASDTRLAEVPKNAALYLKV